ncbi:MAG: 2-oxoglutarate dehydrogenase E1 component, partial [Myxococcales bacterium]|nr:2-oxoglutarate dehydrogenase E1 component [Myxococcales bacterium]
ARVLRLIHAYRARGHRIAQNNPVEDVDEYFPELDPAHYGFGTEDLAHPYEVADEVPGPPIQTLAEIIERLKATYCGPVAVEFTHVQDPGPRQWLRERMEACQNRPSLAPEERKHVLERLSAAELFERFLHTKFLGQKRFSLEGAESLIPLLDTIVEDAPSHGIGEIVFGMAHRGRLNVLANILGKSYAAIFGEFEDSPLLDSPFGSGDVKYHKGFSNDRTTRSGDNVHLTLTSNPSHLEVVDPVVEGRCRAKQVRTGDLTGESIIPVVIHGDAAFAGQGIVAETLNLANLRGYSTGGTIHVIVNNQIGFTTTPAEARSTLYCSDVAKMIQVPVFHVNGDEPESVVYCVKLALAYRQRFRQDVVIDVICYRRHGHNEGDEPSFTSPGLYKRIRARASVRKLYSDALVEAGVITAEEAQGIEDVLGEQLQEALQVIQSRPPGPDEPYEPRGPWTGFDRVRPQEHPDTSASLELLSQVAEGLGSVPQGFEVHPKLRTLLEKRRKSVSDNQPLDWAMGELLAYGTLVLEGTPVRLSGQDSARGTFSHRHAVVVDQNTDEEFCALANLADYQARFEVYDSHLSEAAVLGFEYGYSLADPYTLVLWEAQFGDFVNGAQVIIDQFISSAHVKWQRMSGLVMLLPHGYEGQGPEHSSARIERFLQICAEDCMQVANCTTPAQYFHLLRRQMKRSYRAPLVVFTPKSLLRAPHATSPVEALTHGSFQPLIGDAMAARHAAEVERLIFCSGKVYYDLIAERERRLGENAHRVAICRVEQLYPWPSGRVAEMLRTFKNAERVMWVQEEPRNMGPWTFVRPRLREACEGRAFAYAGRDEAASPATGSMRIHKQEQARLLEDAFAAIE